MGFPSGGGGVTPGSVGLSAFDTTVTLDGIANTNVATGDVVIEGYKLVNVAAGTLSTHAVNLSQIPTALPPSGTAGGDLANSYPNPTIGTGKVTLTKLNSTVSVDAIAGQNAMQGNVPMNSTKLTGLANGSASTDSAAFGQIPLALSEQQFATGLQVPAFPSYSSVTGIASRTYAMRFLCAKSMTVTKIAFVTTVAALSNDNCDAGIFSSDGTTLLGSAGSTAGKLNATAGVQTLTLTGSVALTAGTVYYAAFAYGTVGSTAATLISNSINTGTAGQIMGASMPNAVQLYQSSAFPLAAPFTSTGITANGILLGLLA